MDPAILVNPADFIDLVNRTASRAAAHAAI